MVSVRGKLQLAFRINRQTLPKMSPVVYRRRRLKPDWAESESRVLEPAISSDPDHAREVDGSGYLETPFCSYPDYLNVNVSDMKAYRDRKRQIEEEFNLCVKMESKGEAVVKFFNIDEDDDCLILEISTKSTNIDRLISKVVSFKVRISNPTSNQLMNEKKVYNVDTCYMKYSPPSLQSFIIEELKSSVKKYPIEAHPRKSFNRKCEQNFDRSGIHIEVSSDNVSSDHSSKSIDKIEFCPFTELENLFSYQSDQVIPSKISRLNSRSDQKSEVSEQKHKEPITDFNSPPVDDIVPNVTENPVVIFSVPSSGTSTSNIHSTNTIFDEKNDNEGSGMTNFEGTKNQYFKDPIPSIPLGLSVKSPNYISFHTNMNLFPKCESYTMEPPRRGGETPEKTSSSVEISLPDQYMSRRLNNMVNGVHTAANELHKNMKVTENIDSFSTSNPLVVNLATIQNIGKEEDPSSVLLSCNMMNLVLSDDSELSNKFNTTDSPAHPVSSEGESIANKNDSRSSNESEWYLRSLSKSELIRLGRLYGKRLGIRPLDDHINYFWDELFDQTQWVVQKPKDFTGHDEKKTNEPRVDPYDLVILGRYYESKTFGKECRYAAMLLNYSYWWNRSSLQVRSKKCSNFISDPEYPHLKELTEIPKWILEDVLSTPQRLSKNDEIRDGIVTLKLL